jgi:hypothetical protein
LEALLKNLCLGPDFAIMERRCFTTAHEKTDLLAGGWTAWFVAGKSQPKRPTEAGGGLLWLGLWFWIVLSVFWVLKMAKLDFLFVDSLVYEIE